MEALIVKLQTLHDQSAILEDKEKFDKAIQEKLSSLEKILDEITKMMEDYSYSKEKIEMANLEIIKEKNLAKSLFPYYWFLHKNINNEFYDRP